MDVIFNFDLSSLERAAAHRVGNKHNGDPLIISHQEIAVHSGSLGPLLQTYFLKPFVAPEFFRFTFSNGDTDFNPLCQYCKDIFNDPNRLLINSVHIAKHLYELSAHPNIKSGDLFIAYFHNAVYQNESVDALGIFKSENKQKFLKVDEAAGGLQVDQASGISVDKLDKGCIILNTEATDGYRVLAIDRTNRGSEAQYWMESFLNIEPCMDSFYLTRALINETRQFVVHEAAREVAIDKASQIDLLNKSAAYFKENEQFDRREFEETVFHEPELIDAYRNFCKSSKPEDQGSGDLTFDISNPAVKKYGKVYKSVLKLDKNFHVYIHGNRELIEKGVEADGRKYYKIYYREEA